MISQYSFLKDLDEVDNKTTQFLLISDLSTLSEWFIQSPRTYSEDILPGLLHYSTEKMRMEKETLAL